MKRGGARVPGKGVGKGDKANGKMEKSKDQTAEMKTDQAYTWWGTRVATI